MLDSLFQRRILAALNMSRYPRLVAPGVVSAGHVYGGTVDPAVVARRRKANKAARQARRVLRASRG